MQPKTKQRLRTAIGLFAAVLGGLLAKATAEENFDKLDKMFVKKQAEIEDPRTPPPPAQAEDEPSL